MIFFSFFLKKNHPLERINDTAEQESPPPRRDAVGSGVGVQASQCTTAHLGVVPAADHRVPFGNVHTAWVADQVVVHSSHISILVACHGAIDVVEYGVLVTIQLTVFKPGARLSKEDIQRDLSAGKNQDITMGRLLPSWPVSPANTQRYIRFNCFKVRAAESPSSQMSTMAPNQSKCSVNYDMVGQKKKKERKKSQSLVEVR